jgi:hypothetical protein
MNAPAALSGFGPMFLLAFAMAHEKFPKKMSCSERMEAPMIYKP